MATALRNVEEVRARLDEAEQELAEATAEADNFKVTRPEVRNAECLSCAEWMRQAVPTMTGSGQRIERECPNCRTVLILLDERTHRTQEVKA